MDESAIFALAKDRADLYTWWQHVWFVIHYGAGISAVVAAGMASAATAKGAPKLITEYVWIWGLSASLMTSVVTFLEPLEKAQSYKNAEYALDMAIANFKDKRMKAEELSRILEHAQQVVLGFEKSAAPTKKADK